MNKAPGLQYSTNEMNQARRKESLPPQIPGYTYNANPAYTTDMQYSPQLGGAANTPSNPVFVPSSHIET